MVRSTYEDREGTLWVCTLAGLDAFDRRTEKVTERIRLNVPESRSIKALEDHAGVLWIIYTSGNGLASWDRHTRRLTLYSFKDREPPATELSGAERIYEDADDNLWLTTYGSGLVKIDPSRRSAVQYRAIAASKQHRSGLAHCVVRGPRRDRLGGRAGHRGGQVSEKTAAVQALRR